MNNSTSKGMNPYRNSMYKCQDGENPAALNATVDGFYLDLRNDVENGLKTSVLFDYYDYLSEKEASSITLDDFYDQLKNSDKNRAQGKRDRTNKLIIIRAGLRFYKDGMLLPSDYLKILLSLLISEPKLRGIAHDPDRKRNSLSADSPQYYIGRIGEALKIDRETDGLSNYLTRIIRTLERIGVQKGYDKINIAFSNETKWSNEDWLIAFSDSLRNAAISYQILDFFRERKRKKQGKHQKKGIDPLFLYQKYKAHQENIRTNIHSGKDRYDWNPYDPEFTGKLLDVLRKAERFMGSLQSEKYRKVLIPVAVNQDLRCGIYIAGASFFEAEAKKHILKTYVGLNYISYSYVDCLKEDENSEGREMIWGDHFNWCTGLNEYADFFREDLKECMEALFALNGTPPVECPPEYRCYFSGNDSLQKEEEEIRREAEEQMSRAENNSLIFK